MYVNRARNHPEQNLFCTASNPKIWLTYLMQTCKGGIGENLKVVKASAGSEI